MKDHAATTVGDWIVERRRSRYTPLDLLYLVLGSFAFETPSPPDIAYTLRHRVSGERRRITLPGDHTPAELSAIVDVLRPTRKPSGS